MVTLDRPEAFRSPASVLNSTAPEASLSPFLSPDPLGFPQWSLGLLQETRLQPENPVRQDSQDLVKVCLLWLVWLRPALSSFPDQQDPLEPPDHQVKQLTLPLVPQLESSPDLSPPFLLQHWLPGLTGRASSIHQFSHEPSKDRSWLPE